MSEHKNRECQFVTMVATGEKPDAEIHIVAFEEEGGMQLIGKREGRGRSLARMVDSLVEDLLKNLNESQGPVAVAAFVAGLGQTFGKYPEALRLASVMIDPEAMAGVLGKALSNLSEDDFEDFFGGDD